MTYSCHSAASRAQFSMSAGETRDSEGNDAKSKIMQSASSMSLTASTNVGYLSFRINTGRPDGVVPKICFAYLSLMMWSKR